MFFMKAHHGGDMLLTLGMVHNIAGLVVSSINQLSYREVPVL